MPSSHPLRFLLTNLQREQVLVSLPLHPLTAEQIGSLVAHLPEPLTRDIQTRAAGNPFFAEELAHSAEIQLSVAHTPDSIEYTARSVPLPDTITAILELRISQLGSACQRLLSDASVFGGSFTFPTICQLEMSGNSGTDEDIVLDLIEEALQAGVITEEGTGTHINYHFWHPLLASHLYDELSAARRGSLHRRAANVLQHVYRHREEEGAATITRHLVEGGGNSQHVLHYAELAGNRAYALSAYPEAERYYRTAADHLEAMHKEQGTGESENERLQLAYLLERLGECTKLQGNFENARQFYERTLELRSQQQKLESQIDFKHEAQIQAMLLCEIGWTWYGLGDNERAKQYCELSEQTLHHGEIVAGPTWAILRFQQSYISGCEGNYDKASLLAYEALSLYEDALKQQNHSENKVSHPKLTGTELTLLGDPVNLGRIHMQLGILANSMGQSSEALKHFKTSLAVFEQFDRQREIANVSCNIGDIHLRKAEHELAQAALRRSLNLAERVGDVPLMSVVFANFGVLAARFGSLLEAEAWFKRGITLAEQINDQIYLSLFHAYLALVHQDQGQLPEARACVCRALTIGRAIGNTPCIGIALVALGKLRLTLAMEAYETRTSVIRQGSLPPSQADIGSSTDMHTRFFQRARKTVQHALILEGIDSETRSEGYLLEAEISLLLGNLGTAEQLTTSILERAREQELTDLHARVQRLLGEVLTAQGKPEQAYEQFEGAVAVFRRCNMTLEYARTLQRYGAALLQNHSSEQTSYQRGLGFLREAQQIFLECQAAHDLQAVEQILAMLVSA